MEQLINAATPSYYAMLSFCFLGIGIICTSVLIFIESEINTEIKNNNARVLSVTAVGECVLVVYEIPK